MCSWSSGQTLFALGPVQQLYWVKMSWITRVWLAPDSVLPFGNVFSLQQMGWVTSLICKPASLALPKGGIALQDCSGGQPPALAGQLLLKPLLYHQGHTDSCLLCVGCVAACGRAHHAPEAVHVVFPGRDLCVVTVVF